MIRFFIFPVIGAMPGMAIMPFWFRYGLAWSFVGACIGLTFAFRGVKASRVVPLFFNVIVSSKVPSTDFLVEPNNDALTDEEFTNDARFIFWFCAGDIEDRRDWVIGLAFCASLLVMAAVAIHDYICIQRNIPPWFLFPSEKNGFTSLVLGHLIFVSCWVCGIAGIFFSPAYKRPCLSLLAFPLLLFAAMAIIGYEKSLDLFLGFGAFSLGVGLFLGWAFGLDERWDDACSG